jgi:hypothetical protein
MEPVTPSFVTKNRIYRSSGFGIEIRLSVTRDGAWLVIRRLRVEPYYRDIPEAELDAVVGEFQAIRKDPAKFQAFVNAENRQGIKIGRDRADP